MNKEIAKANLRANIRGLEIELSLKKEELMQPGPELDALIATKVMGLIAKNIAAENSGYGCTAWFGPETEGILLPNYSTNIADAWKVVDKLRLGFYFQLSDGLPGSKWTANFTNDDEENIGDTAPHAICLAALKAVGVV